MLVCTNENAVPRLTGSPTGKRRRISDYFGSVLELQPGPQGFLVEFNPAMDPVIKPHFHRVPQFQIVIDGGGRIGKHDLAPVSVHFADAYTPYGPIVCGEEGIAFFTLRVVADVNAFYMPGSREHLAKLPRRAFTAQVAAGVQAASTAEIDEQIAISLQPDGLGATALTLPPNAAGRPQALGKAGDRYYVVLSGALRHNGAELPARSCLFNVTDDGSVCLQAGEEGAHVLALQFPRRA